MKTKVLLCCFVAALLCTQLYAQQFITKQKSYHMTMGYDERIDIRKTVDGGLIMCDVNFFSGGTADYWVIKVDSLGRKQKEITLGGDGDDRCFSVTPTRDHGYLVAGISNSGISGSKTAAPIGGYDYWLVKLDSLGHQQWDKTYGTIYDDGGKAEVDTTLNGGYVLGGTTGGGLWITRLDSTGDVLWTTTKIAGSENYFEKVYHTADGGFIVGGNVWSYYAGSYGQDYYIAKLDADGNTVWEKLYGSTNPYDNLYSIIETTDGGYLAGGASEGGAGKDKTEPSRGSGDFWLVKMDANGNKLWDKTLGGNSGEDLCHVANTADGGYVAAGASSSAVSGEKTEPSRGFSDNWIVKLNNKGQVQWDKTIGGDNTEECSMVLEFKKNEYVFGGYSHSGISGDRTVPFKGGYEDFWVVGLKYKPVTGNLIMDNRFSVKTTPAVTNSDFKIYPNPAKDVIHIQAAGYNSYTVVDVTGKTVLSKSINGSGTINVSQLPAGVYYLQNSTAHTSSKVAVTH